MFEKHPPMVPALLLALGLAAAPVSAGEFDLLDARLSEAVLAQVEAKILPELIESCTRDLEFAIARRLEATRREQLVQERSGSARPASYESSEESPKR